jgi:hypothetical protein
MFRGLSALDVPSREAARGRLVAEELKLMEKRQQLPGKLTGQMIRDAVRLPELFLSPEAIARIAHESAQTVFQEKNVVARYVLGAESQLPGPVRFALRGVLPVVGIPIRLGALALEYSPAGLFTHAARHALNGNSREAKLSVSRAMLGTLAWTAGAYLYDKSLIGPPLDAADEQQKNRLAQGEFLPPNHLNVSGLERAFKGEPTEWRKGDRTVDLTYYGAILGGQVQLYAGIRRLMEKQPESESRTEEAGQLLGAAVQSAGSYLINQTFMEGTRDLLDAFRSERKFEEFTARYAGSLSDTVLPRQMDAIARATREYAREVKDDKLDQRIENMIVQRLGPFTQADDKLPFKRDLFGQPIRETPAGSNPWIYQVFDVGRSRVMPDEPLKLELYNLARRTGDVRALPTPPDANLRMNGVTYRLTAEQQSELAEEVGRRRLQIAERAMTQRFLGLPDEQKLAALATVWSYGAQAGNFQFFKRHRTDLEQKAPPRGFQAE